MNQTATIDEYIKQFPANVQAILQQIKTTVQQAAPDATEAVKYGIPTFILHQKNLVHFGAFKNHIGFYPTPVGIEEFKEELMPYKTAKGSVQFPLKEPIPFHLISKIVLFNVNKINNKIKRR